MALLKRFVRDGIVEVYDVFKQAATTQENQIL